MKKVILVLIGFVVALVSTVAADGMSMPKNYRMVALDKATMVQEDKNKMYCSKCGMTLPMFYRTNHAAKVDGVSKQFCSIYCLVDAMSGEANVTDVRVVDNTTLKFIRVSQAYYVVGSKKPATMAKKVSKYAFGTKKAADGFADKFGGKVMKYDEMLLGAKRDFDSDSKAKEIRQAKASSKGKSIYAQKCKKIDKKFTSVAEAKEYIVSSGACGKIKGKMLQSLGLYLTRKVK